MTLATYRTKRRFDQTPEPAGATARQIGALRFVVQKHEASRLHFDFRLEAGGVLKSWAVPKGPSLNPADKRLAVMVEDHPFDYRTFEGVIPAGNYGAGSVMVWDEGTYQARGAEGRRASEKAVAEGLKRGRLSIVLEGQKLRGEFSLIRLAKGKANNWLLVKKNDEFADPTAKFDERSALSGRDMEEIAAGAAASPAAADRKKRTPTRVVAKRASPQTFVRPMLATAVDKAFDRDGWFFEVKWDGYRAIADVRDGNVRLDSRNHKPLNEKFAPIVQSLEHLGRDALLDGEIVVLDEQGKAQFELLQNYQRTGKGQLAYYVFDLLALDARDLRDKPLRERRQALAGLLKGQNANILLSEQVETEGVAFFAAASDQGLEGIVAKNGASRYHEGARNLDWLKIKTHKRQEAVIGGFTQPKGGRQGFGALVLGVYDGADLVYIGHAGGGFNTGSLTDLRGRLEPLRQRACPFTERPQTNTPAQWVKPTLVCEVKFQEWTKDGHMRHPIFLGLRDDKQPGSVRREANVPAEEAVEGLPKKTAGRRKSHRLAPGSGSAPSLTHLEKIYWPEEGYTKGDLIAYYRDVASIILPYLKDRPLSLNRHPNGIAGQNFFQKDVTRQPPPPEVKTVSIPVDNEKQSILAPLCQNEASLLYLVNLGCIEMNPWNARIADLDRPDYLIIDLDPEDTPFAHVVETALTVRSVLDKAECPSYCKTSGKRGLHVYVPLAAKYDGEQARQFAEVVANIVHGLLRETTSLIRSPAKRQRKVYLDYLQNRRGQTLAAAYSVRPYPGATVSTPLKWSEVSKRLDPSRFTMRTMRKRFDRVGDLWQGVLGKGIDLDACLKRLTQAM